MKLIAGVDIGNSTTEVCIGSVGEDGRFQFLSSASRITTGTKGTLPNVHGVKAALEEAMHRIGMPLEKLDLDRTELRQLRLSVIQQWKQLQRQSLQSPL